MKPFEITDYKMFPFQMEIEYVYGEYNYKVLCDFDWSEECTSHYTDFTVTPLCGTFFHELNDEKGRIEITEHYKTFLNEKLKDFRNKTLWLYNESLEKMRDLDNNEQDWSYYGI